MVPFTNIQRYTIHAATRVVSSSFKMLATLGDQLSMQKFDWKQFGSSVGIEENIPYSNQS